MNLPMLFRYLALALACIGTILSFPILLARYVDRVDAEYPIFLSEYFEINPLRLSIVDNSAGQRDGQISDVADSLATTWVGFKELSTALAYPEAAIKVLQNSSDLEQAGLATLLLATGNVGTGPITADFDLYSKNFQALLALAEPDALYDSEDAISRASYDALTGTLSSFELYVNGSDLNTTAGEAATGIISNLVINTDIIFERMRNQTRVAVAAALAVIVCFSIAFTILLVDHKTYALVVLQLVAVIAGFVFIGMIALNKSDEDEFVLLTSAVPLPTNIGPAVYAAGFSSATGVLGAVVSTLYVRLGTRSGSKLDGNGGERVPMDVIEAETK